MIRGVYMCVKIGAIVHDWLSKGYYRIINMLQFF